MKNIMLFSVAVLMWTACESKTPRIEVDGPDYYVPVEFSEDLEVSGIITAVDEQEVSVMTEAGDTCTFLLDQAEADHKVFGGYNLNDHVVVVPGRGEYAEELVNLTTLVGRWVYKNVTEEESGINIKEGGSAASINNDTQSYHGWTMAGTRLLLTWSGDGSDGISELIDSCEIRYLSRDTLKLVSHYDPSLEMTYYRQK